MRAASTEELGRAVEPVLTARISPERFRKLVPLPTRELHALSAPEPSEGVVAQLENGEYVVFEYGRTTQTLKASLIESVPVDSGLEALLQELPLKPEEILWCSVEQPASA
jgi:hypothetical protein